MTEERIAELRALCAEYERNKSIDEALGHGNQAADIAADGVGRRALESLPELLNELELVRRDVEIYETRYRSILRENIQLSEMARKAEASRDHFLKCYGEMFDIVDCLSTWLANAYIDPCLLPDIGRNGIEPPQPKDVIAYAKECINDNP